MGRFSTLFPPQEVPASTGKGKFSNLFTEPKPPVVAPVVKPAITTSQFNGKPKNWVAEGLKQTAVDIGKSFLDLPTQLVKPAESKLATETLPYLAEKAVTPIGEFQMPVLTPRNIKPLFTGQFKNIETTPVAPSPLDIGFTGYGVVSSLGGALKTYQALKQGKEYMKSLGKSYAPVVMEAQKKALSELQPSLKGLTPEQKFAINKDIVRTLAKGQEVAIPKTRAEVPLQIVETPVKPTPFTGKPIEPGKALTIPGQPALTPKAPEMPIIKPVVPAAAPIVPQAPVFTGKAAEAPKQPVAPPVIPQFQSTEEAITFGKQNKDNPAVLQALQVSRDNTLAEIEQIKAQDNLTDEQLQQGMNKAVEAQFYREALEGAAEAPKPPVLAFQEAPGAEVVDREAITTGEGKVEYRSTHQIDAKTASPITQINEENINSFITEFKNQYGYPALKSKEVNKLKSIMSNPDADITIYRASPKNELNSGDWVTINKDYANDIRKQNGGKVYTHTVKAKELFYPKTLEGFKDLPSLNKWGAFQYQSSKLSTPTGQKPPVFTGKVITPGIEPAGEGNLIEEAKKYKSAEEFVNSKQQREGEINIYDLDDSVSQQKLVDDIEKSKRKGEYFAIGLRGLYKNEIGKKKLPPSFTWEDGNMTEQKLGGTSVVGVVSDWDNADNNDLWKGLRKALDMVEKYGDTGKIAIIKGKYLKDEIFNDLGEFVLGNAQVIGYIGYYPESQLTDIQLTDIWNKANAQKPQVEPVKVYSPEDLQVIGEIKKEIEAGQPGHKWVGPSDSYAPGKRTVGIEPSTYPPYFQRKGYTKKNTLKIINKIESKEPLTEKQRALIDDLIQSRKEQANEEARVIAQGATQSEVDEADRIGEAQALSDKETGEINGIKIFATPQEAHKYITDIESKGGQAQIIRVGPEETEVSYYLPEVFMGKAIQPPIEPPKTLVAGQPQPEEPKKTISVFEPQPLKPSKVKEQIRKVTGQIKIGDLIREDIALREVLKKEEQISKKAFREGKVASAEERKVAYFGQQISKKERSKLYLMAKDKGLYYTDWTGLKHDKLAGLLKFYRSASFDQLRDYISELTGTPENPPKLLKLFGDINKDTEVIKLINKVSGNWEDINKIERDISLDAFRIIEKVTGQNGWEDNILADNTVFVFSAADEAYYDRLVRELNELDANRQKISKGSKESSELSRKVEMGEVLTQKEKEVDEYIHKKDDLLIAEANDMRMRLGKKLIPYRQKYRTHIREQNILADFFKGDYDRMKDISPAQLDAIRKGDYTKGNMPFNKFALQRTGPKTKYDAIGNYEIYLRTILKEIYYTPAITHVRKFIDYALIRQPNAYKSLDRLANDLKGKTTAIDNVGIGAFASHPAIKKMRSLLAKSALLGNLNFWLMNSSNFAISYGELGNYMNKGIAKFLGTKEWRTFAFKHSNMMKGRTVDPDIDPRAFKKIEEITGYITNLLEYNNVGSTFIGAYFKGIDLGYSQAKSIKYADSIARRTQVGYKKYELNAWMRSNTGMLISQFQTWTFAMMNHILYDIGVANIPRNVTSKFTGKTKKPVKWAVIFRLIAISMLLNLAYKKAGLREPYQPESGIPRIPGIGGTVPPLFRVGQNIVTAFKGKQPETRQRAASRVISSFIPMGTQINRLFNGKVLPPNPDETKTTETNKYPSKYKNKYPSKYKSRY